MPTLKKQFKKPNFTHVLCIGLEDAVMGTVESCFFKEDLIFHAAHQAKKAIKILLENEVELMIIDQDFFSIHFLDFIQKCSSSVMNPAMIVLTHDHSPQNMRKLIQLKMSDCLSKPIDAPVLIESIRCALADRKRSIYGIKDPLTGFYNRYALKEILKKEIDRAKRYHRHLSLLMIDVDYFKSINDEFGHLVGDTILEEIADILKASVRKTDVLSRFGGEEFAVILPETTIGHATMLAERIRKKIEEHNYTPWIGNKKITVSIGISNYHTPDQKSDLVLIHSADQALYAAKKEGRNKVCISIPPRETRILR
ncbi:MAG: diguanylate cyclase [Deltaproteobacteria bacterium]|nr:diguanylate cyclase [Deltaproteobacteria bacterium]